MEKKKSQQQRFVEKFKNKKVPKTKNQITKTIFVHIDVHSIFFMRTLFF